MDDVHTFHTRAYDKSVDFEEQSLLQRAIKIAPAVPNLIVKTSIVICALIYHLVQQILHCFVPKPLKDIRGQLAVVSVTLCKLPNKI